MRIEKESTHSSARAQSRARNRPRERGSGGAVRAARARSGGASAAVRRAIATRMPLRRAPLRPGAAPLAASSTLCAAVCSSSRRQPPMPIEMGTERAFRCSFSHAENLSQATDHRSAAVGGVRTDLARAARDVAGELSAVAASGGAGGCGVELGDGRAFPPSASDARSRAGRRGWRRRRRYKNSCRPRMRDKREVRAAWRRPDELTAQPRESAQAGDPLRHSACFCDVSKGVARRCTLRFGLRLSVN